MIRNISLRTRRGQRLRSHEGDKKSRVRDACVSVEINFPHCEKAPTGPIFSRPSLSVDPRDISSEDSGPKDDGALVKRRSLLVVSRCRGVRKGCESSSCLCSCCCRYTLWCLRGPFVNDYGFLSPAPSLHPCKERGRKRGARQDCDASLRR